MKGIGNTKSNGSKYVSWHLYSTLPYTYILTTSQISIHSMTFSFFLRFPEILLYSKIIPHTSIVHKRVKCFSLMMKLSKILPLHSFVHIIGFQVM